MTVRKYFDEIKKIVDKYSSTRYVVDAIVNFDIRSGDQGYFKRSHFICG